MSDVLRKALRVRFARPTLAATAFGAALGLLAASTAHAQGESRPPLEGGALAAAPVEPLAQTGKHKLVTTYTDYGAANNLALPAGYVNLESLSVKCNDAAGCTLGADVFAQVSPPSGTEWAICVKVNGVDTQPGCPYQGTLPAKAGAYVAGQYKGTIKVTQGTHTVTPQVYVSKASVLGAWTMDLKVYTP